MIWERKPRPPNLIVRKKITQTPLSWEWVTGCIVSKESGSKTLSVNVVNSLLMTVAFSSPLNAWFRPSLDEALQWRDSLDKLLQNNCKLELSFIKGQGRDRGQKKKITFVLPVSFFSNSDISSIFQSGLSKGRMSRECGHPAHEKRKVYLHWKTDNVKIKCPEDSGLHVVFPSVLLIHVAWPVCLMFSTVKERYCLSAFSSLAS